MAARLVEALARAFGMLVFVTAYLLIAHREFPKNWFALLVVYAVCVPVAAAYRWLSDAPPPGGNARRWRVPKLLLVAIGAALAISGYTLFTAQVDSFYAVK